MFRSWICEVSNRNKNKRKLGSRGIYCLNHFPVLPDACLDHQVRATCLKAPVGFVPERTQWSFKQPDPVTSGSTSTGTKAECPNFRWIWDISIWTPSIPYFTTKFRRWAPTLGGWRGERPVRMPWARGMREASGSFTSATNSRQLSLYSLQSLWPFQWRSWANSQLAVHSQISTILECAVGQCVCILTLPLDQSRSVGHDPHWI